MFSLVRCFLFVLTISFLFLTEVRAQESKSDEDYENFSASTLENLKLNKRLSKAKVQKSHDLVIELYNVLIGRALNDGRKLDAYKLALDFEEYSEDTHQELVDVEYYLGLSLAEMGMRDTAFFYFDKAISLFETNGHPDISIVYDTYGYHKLLNKNFDDAIELFDLALKTSTERSRGSIFLHLSKAHLDNGNFKEALNYLEKGRPENELDLRYYLAYKYRLAELHFKQNDPRSYAEAKECYLKSKKANLSSYEKLSLRLLWEIAIDKNDYQLVGRFAKKLDSLKRRLDDQSFSKSVNHLSENRELLRIQAEEKRKKTELEATLNFTWKVASVCIVLFLIFLLWYNRKMRLAQIEKAKLVSKGLADELDKKNLKIKLAEKLLQLELSNKTLDQFHEQVEKFEKTKNINDLTGKLKSKQFKSAGTFWSEFELQFKEINSDYYNKIVDTYPNLTNNERRLIIFIKLNLTSKEIVEVTGKTKHSIDVARYRLRKKLGISNTSVSLYSFLEKVVNG